MNKFIRRYQKQLLAIFGVLLMIVFIIPSSMKSGRTATRRVIGHVGKEPVYADEKTQAAADWQILHQIGAYLPFIPDQNSFSQPWAPRPAPYSARLGVGLSNAIDADPDLYLLMQKEAAARGITVSADQVNTVVANDLYLMRELHPSPDVMGEERFNNLVSAVARFLPVAILKDRVASDVKITQPMWKHALVQTQAPKLAIAQFTASEFAPAVPAPTPQQLQAFYDKYSKVIPDKDRATDDSLGLGYSLPERIKLQYLMVPQKQVKQAVSASRKPYDWEVDERMYYYDHQQNFVRPAPKPTTAPATQAATTQPSTQVAATLPAGTQPSTQVASTAPAAAPSAEPTTRPFSEVQSEIADTVMQKPIAELTDKITAAIVARLSADAAKEAPATAPSTGPSTAPAAGPSTAPTTAPSDKGFASKAYLDSVALDIQKQFNVLPEVVQLGDWQDEKQLSALAGIGSAMAGDKMFAQLALSGASASTSLGLYQPSPVLKAFDGDAYIFRLTDRSPMHAQPLAEIADKVKADYQVSLGYTAARDAAKALLDKAQKGTFAAAASAANRPVINAGPIAMGSIPGFDVSMESQFTLATKARDMLATATPQNQHPVSMIELPADRKVIVAQLQSITGSVPRDILYAMEITRTLTEANRQEQTLARDYFTPEAIRARIGYVPESTEKSEAGS